MCDPMLLYNNTIPFTDYFTQILSLSPIRCEYIGYSGMTTVSNSTAQKFDEVTNILNI